MKKSFVLLAWVLLSVLTLSAQDRSIDIRTLPHIDISGHAEAKVQPDTFEISVVFGETKEFFGKQNIEKLEQQIVDVLKGSGFDIQKDVKVTASYNIAEGKTVFIRKRIAFTVHSYAQYYDIAKQLDFKGVENVSITKASYSGEEALKSKLRAKALSDALHSAQDILAGSGFQVGRILSVNAGRAYVQARIANAPAYDAIVIRATAAKSEEFESFEQSDEITITFDLQASFEIVQDK